MTFDLTVRRLVILGSPIAMNAGGGATTERKIRISRPDGGSARCRGSRVRGQPNDFCPSTPRPPTPSMSSATSSQQKRTAHSGPLPCRHGARSPLRLEPSGVDGFAASAIPQRDNAEQNSTHRSQFVVAECRWHPIHRISGLSPKLVPGGSMGRWVRAVHADIASLVERAGVQAMTSFSGVRTRVHYEKAAFEAGCANPYEERAASAPSAGIPKKD
jgi:hypothetical protein